MWQATTKENLPLPYVEYPYAWLGAFPGFQATSGSQIYFCECQRRAIFNRIALWPPGIHGTQMMRTGFKVPDTEDFPWSFFKPILDKKPSSDEDFTHSLEFRANICHQCNRRVPHPPSWLPPSTDAFSTLFRFYSRKIAYTHGVDLSAGLILSDCSSSDIRQIVPYHPAIYRNSTESWSNHWSLFSERHTIWRQYERPLADFFQNELRKSLGFPTKGPRLTSETILYLRTASAFSDYEVVRHHRPQGFGRLSLDIFIPKLAIAIEYQGEQHRSALPHWGGEKALQLTVARDARKAALCEKHGISLIYFEGNVTFITEHEIHSTLLSEIKYREKVNSRSKKLK